MCSIKLEIFIFIFPSLPPEDIKRWNIFYEPSPPTTTLSLLNSHVTYPKLTKETLSAMATFPFINI